MTRGDQGIVLALLVTVLTMTVAIGIGYFAPKDGLVVGVAYSLLHTATAMMVGWTYGEWKAQAEAAKREEWERERLKSLYEQRERYSREHIARLKQIGTEEVDEWERMYRELIEDRNALLVLLLDDSPAVRESIAPSVRRLTLQRDSYTCSWCGRAGSEALDPDGHPWHIDHVIPVSRGGPTKPGNLTTACRSCNARKSDKSPFEFLRSK